MPYQSSQGKTAVGLFVDGLQLKYAQLSLTAGKVTLRDVKTVALVAKLEQKAARAKAAGWPGDGADGDRGVEPEKEKETKEDTTNASVMLGLLGDLPPRNYTVSFALTEPAIAYQEFDADLGLKDSKLKNKILQKVAESGVDSPDSDALDAIPTASGGLLSITRRGGLELYDLLTEIRPSLGGRIPNIKLIHSADLALMELVRSSYELSEQEVSVLVYVAYDFTRVIFMQGNVYLHFAPVISEGLDAANIGDTIYRRIKLELENNTIIKRIDRILLSGESHKVGLLDAMAAEFPDARVEYLKVPAIDLSFYTGDQDEVISQYAIPIAVAWRALQPKLKAAFDIDIIPSSILESQKQSRLAWHAWLAAALIVASLVFFFAVILLRANEIGTARDSLSQKQEKVAELKMYKARKDSLKAGIARYEHPVTVYNSIARGADRWSRILLFVGNTVKNLNSIWIYSIRSVQGNPSEFDVSGRALMLPRVSSFVKAFEKASLLQVRTITVRNRDIYEFDVRVEKTDKEDIPYVPPKSKK